MFRGAASGHNTCIDKLSCTNLPQEPAGSGLGLGVEDGLIDVAVGCEANDAGY